MGAVYNTLSFALASMMATTMYLWFRSFAVRDQFQSAVLISGLVCFIAAYHYIRIFNSWVDAYEYSPGVTDPSLTGVPFNDAYRYMDWLLTVPLLLIEILLVMKLDEETYNAKSKTLGIGSALMIVSGYYGELTVTGDLTPRWACWALSMCFFLYTVVISTQHAEPSKAKRSKEVAGFTGPEMEAPSMEEMNKQIVEKVVKKTLSDIKLKN